jgi:lipooligosaccharide transport system permease protein
MTSLLHPRHSGRSTGGPASVFERNLIVFRRIWKLFLAGLAEPFLWLASIGVGVGALVTGFVVAGRTLTYAEFVAPALLASTALNGAIMDSTFNVFFKLKYDRVYDAMLATPLTTGDIVRGDLAWATARGGIYSAVFLMAMALLGLTDSWWVLLALPATLLISLATSAVGFALTTFMRSWQDFEYIQLVMMPMLLFSGIFFPVSTYPDAMRWVVELTPLYRAVALVRELSIGPPGWASLASVAYLLVMAAIGVAIASRRLDRVMRP